MNEEQVLSCPVDGETMVRQQHGEGSIHACVSCRGIWLPRTYLLAMKRKAAQQLKRLKGEPLEAKKHSVPLVCPECRSNLLPRVYELVPIDICGQCRAVWLDGDEILQIAQRTSAKEIRDQSRRSWAADDTRIGGSPGAAMVNSGGAPSVVSAIGDILNLVIHSISRMP